MTLANPCRDVSAVSPECFIERLGDRNFLQIKLHSDSRLNSRDVA